MNTETLREICLKHPAVTEDIKWGNDLVFSVGEKMFLVIGLNEPPSASFKVKDEEFEEMSAREGFMPAPYVARYKWVYVDQLSRISEAEWKERIGTSYCLVAARLPAKLKKQLGLA